MEGLIDGIETANPHSQAPLNVLARLLLYNSPNNEAIDTAGSDAHYFSGRSREIARGIGLTGVVVNGAFDYSSDIGGMVAMVDMQRLAERTAARNN